MRIVFLMYLGDIGGAEQVTLQHALLAKKNKLDAVVLTAQKGIVYDIMLKNKINVICCPELQTDKAPAFLEKYLKDADVVYNCNYWAITRHIPKLKAKYDFQYLTVVHSNINWVFDQLKPYDNITDKYLATHDLIKAELIKSGFPENKIVLIPNSIDVSQIGATNENIKWKLKHELGIPEDDLVIGMTTRINYDKNVNDSVRILNLVNKKIPVSLVIIGEACYSKESFAYKEKLLELINKSPYKKKFHLLGKLTSKEVYNWQRVFDVAINISPSEGTPITLFEQMAAGIYCMYPSIGGIPEVLTNNGSVIPIRQRLLSEEINRPACYTDEEIEMYVSEIFKYSKAYFIEMGLKSRDFILKNRSAELFENDILNFLNGGKMKVSVLMTTFNSSIEFLKQSIDSILKQTYSNFEFIIVDDCSTYKQTISFLKECADQDKRIKLFFKPENTGLGDVLNFGLKECSGDLIIKMDHDDIAFPDLIKKQLNYFRKNPDAVICGVQLKCFGNHQQITKHPEVITKEYVKNMQGSWIMNHPGVAYKKEMIISIGGYSTIKGISEDYNLWCRILQAGYVLNNQNEILINYRTYQDNYTGRLRNTQVYQDSIKESKKCLFDKKYADKVTYHMATMPDRINVLKESVASILPQCDELHIYLNGFKTIPDLLKNPKITAYLSNELHGDIGDVGKFHNCESWTGYNFTADDKIIYPPDYTEKTIKKIEEYNRKAIVTHHGRIMHTDRKCSSYYKDHKFIIDCYRHASKDIELHIPGTGVMAFHSDNIKLDMNIFTHTNMTDIFIGSFAKNNSINIIGLQHPADWIRISKYFDQNRSICRTFANNDKIQTDLVNSIFTNQ